MGNLIIVHTELDSYLFLTQSQLNILIISLLFLHSFSSWRLLLTLSLGKCVGCVSLLLNLLSFALSDLAIYDDRAIREQPRHLTHCKTLWSNSIGLPSSNQQLWFFRRLQTIWNVGSSCPVPTKICTTGAQPQWLWTQPFIHLGLWISEHDSKDITPSLFSDIFPCVHVCCN